MKLESTLLDPARLLVKNLGYWLPWAAGLSMLGALPEVVGQFWFPDLFSFSGLLSGLDSGTTLLTAGVLVLFELVRVVLELATYMFVFVVLADLTAGRPHHLGQGLVRLASWRLQGAWLVVGLVEQTAMSLWWLGGAVLLVPFGLVTPAAYEEDSGFGAFRRSSELGMGAPGTPALERPGVHLAIAVTLGFFAGFCLNTVVGLASCVTGSSGDEVGQLLTLLQGGMPELTEAPRYGWTDAAMTLVSAPLALLPTIYMMTAQQMVYWRAVNARR